MKQGTRERGNNRTRLKPSSGERGCEHLFVYGTLYPGHAPEEIADLVCRFEIAGKGTVPGTLYNLGSYPGGVLEERTGRRIAGTVFRLPGGQGILSRLDAYEEFDPEAPERSLFIRRLHPVRLDNGRMLRCWVYEYNGSTQGAAAIIESGRYGLG